MKILLIEDDAGTRQTMERLLAAENLTVLSTDSGAEAVSLARYFDYDVILLDLGLPDLHGHDVLHRLRAAGVSTPVMIMSGAEDTGSKVTSFHHGADDYLTKPFQVRELVARIHAVVRRSKGFSQSTIRTGRMAFHLGAKAVEVDGKSLPLTNKEYQVLELLSLRKGKVVAKETLLNHLYGGPDIPDLKIIDVFIYKLRKKLRNATGGGDYITTVRGRGYVLNAAAGEPAA
ncbi:response regulator transcription factor [Roseobacteraceae bacterium NS-SX3]